ncbi:MULTISPECIES: tripartite tricarboxylate transporter substrate-binding protein [Rhizobium]|uniref:Tripartite-type tricarboxylate transporter receptor subunit TctC n=1 Tax=Rhizobium metallidurans TaxID=1265931 RepID=A0A7W6CUD4_9HYPH|nr:MULTISPECIES: tripartite tricarboxylate transporter substrate-binding protein [Rhizobium]MBB3967335.1 tripartite-type tricarboxylate transporter receptor subunit TctC [Rhizobium metallidurans]
MKKLSAGMVLAATLAVAGQAMAFEPTRPVEFVVASGPGGGTDNFARTIQSIITKRNLMSKPMVILNKGGGSGAEAFLYAKKNEGDANKLYFGTNNAYLLPRVAKMAYSMKDLQPVSALAFDEFLIWVKADSAYKTPKELIDAGKAEPGKVAFAGSQSKDTDETLVALIKQTTGAKFKYLPFNGGGEVGVQLAGGHVAANVNNPNENLGQWQAGAVKPLCVFSPTPMAKGEPVYDGKGWGDIPTCVSQGVPIDNYKMPRTVWAAAGTPPDAIAYYAEVMKKVSETPEWADYIKKTSQTGDYLGPDKLQEFISSSETNAVKVFKEEGWLVQ